MAVLNSQVIPFPRRVFTQSELTTFMRDRRHWWLAYYRGLRKRHDRPFLPEVGNFVHAGLAAFYTPPLGEQHPIDVVRNRATALIEQHPDFAETIADAAGMAGIMLEGYLEWVEETGADADLEVYAAEETVEVPLEGTPYILRGKIDARARRKSDGALVQLEHKTVGNLAELPKTAQSNFQYLTYDLLAYLKSLEGGGERTDGVLLNMLRRVKRTARANPPFYGRHEVRHNTQELRSHWKHVVAIAHEIEAATVRLDNGDDPHFVCPPAVSRDSSWRNPFLPVYQLLDDGSDAEGFLAAEYEQHDPLARYEES